ncbi:hypothetical protein D3C86_1590090 [compost metagenome]
MAQLVEGPAFAEAEDAEQLEVLILHAHRFQLLADRQLQLVVGAAEQEAQPVLAVDHAFLAARGGWQQASVAAAVEHQRSLVEAVER